MTKKLKPHFLFYRNANMECSICFEEIKRGKTLTCGHEFHAKCINQWVKVGRNRNCPMCRTYIIPVKNVMFNAILQKIANVSGAEFERFDGNTKSPSTRLMLLNKIRDALAMPELIWEQIPEHAPIFLFNQREIAYLTRMAPAPFPVAPPPPPPATEAEENPYGIITRFVFGRSMGWF